MCNTGYLLLLVAGIGFTFQEVDLSPEFYWRNYNHGDIPYDALEAYPGLYIGQAHFSTGLFPASIYPYRNNAVAMLGPRVNVTEHLKILCSPKPSNFYWDAVDFTTDNVTLMKDAVVGGFQDTWLTYIGLVYHLDNWKIGKVFDIEDREWKGVYVWDNDGSRVILQHFKLLKYNSKGYRPSIADNEI